MYVRVFVTECTITKAKQSVCLNYIKQLKTELQTPIKTAITSGSPNVSNGMSMFGADRQRLLMRAYDGTCSVLCLSLSPSFLQVGVVGD